MNIFLDSGNGTCVYCKRPVGAHYAFTGTCPPSEPIQCDHGYTVHFFANDPTRAYFARGGEAIGGLWFEGKTLTDHDGTFALPRSVAHGLRAYGYIVSPDFE